MIIYGETIRSTVTTPLFWFWEIEKEIFPKNKILSIKLKKKRGIK
jgi:hypothetical protein